MRHWDHWVQVEKPIRSLDSSPPKCWVTRKRDIPWAPILSLGPVGRSTIFWVTDADNSPSITVGHPYMTSKQFFLPHSSLPSADVIYGWSPRKDGCQCRADKGNNAWPNRPLRERGRQRGALPHLLSRINCVFAFTQPPPPLSCRAAEILIRDICFKV